MILTLFAAAAGLAAGQPAVAAAPAPAATVAPVAAPARTLAALPNTTITYFDIPGRKLQDIRANLTKMMADPAQKETLRLFSWNTSASINRRTEGTVCKVTSAKSTLTATVHLPRLAESKLKAEELAVWNNYVAGLESDAAANLWLINDGLPVIEKSLTNMPCDQANAAWNAGLEKLGAQQHALATQQAATAAAAEAAATADAKAKAAAQKQNNDD